jgi:hypothetical protein
VSRYKITHNYGMMPNQIQGIIEDGEEFYFRGRHGKWQLHFGPIEDDSFAGLAYEGEHEQAGWFEKEEWESFFWEVIELVEQGRASLLDWDRHEKDMKALLVRLTTPAIGKDWERFHALVKEEQERQQT